MTAAGKAMTAKQDVEGMIERLSAEADLCRSETADDIAKLLDEAAAALTSSQAECRELQAEVGRLKRGLDFYARGCHFSHDSDVWDTVSGEPPNYWCDEEGSTVEDGAIAKLFLEGWDWHPDDAEERMIPPAALAGASGKGVT
jgi:hypothetical protein